MMLSVLVFRDHHTGTSVAPIRQNPNFLQVDPLPLLSSIPQLPEQTRNHVDHQMTEVEIGSPPTAGNDQTSLISHDTSGANLANRRVTFSFDEPPELNVINEISTGAPRPPTPGTNTTISTPPENPNDP